MDLTTVEIPAGLLEAADLSPDDVKVELAILLYKQGRITLEQAAFFSAGSAKLDGIFQKKEKITHIDMDDFISWAAHDLKSPLNAIIGFTKVVLKGIDGPVTDLQVTDLTSAHVSGQRMLTLINNLIDMARLNNGDLKIETGPGNLEQTITDAANRWKLQNPTKTIETHIHIQASSYHFDPARMRQVLNGLLTYAANHVAEGGTVSLLVKEGDEHINVEIKSSGEKARDKYEMDLAMIAFICRGLIVLHGGSLKLGEDTGAGIALSFHLPKA